MNINSLFIATSAIAFFSGSAGAADLYVPPTPESAVTAATAFDWTGGYIGAQVGYTWGNAPAPYSFVAGGPYTLPQDPANQTGFVGGVHAGYNFQTSNLVLGVEGDIEKSGVGGDDGGSGGDINALNNNWQGSLRGRLGFAVDSILLYGTAGMAVMNATATAPGHTADVTFTGWTAGVGLEYALTANLTSRVEYRYSSYGAKEAAFPVNGYYESYSPAESTIRVGLSYKF
jgi:outer membrane immunogenic protein